MPEARKVTPTPADPKRATPETLDPDRICAEIIAGRHTGHLAELLAAIREASLSGSSSMRWRIKLDALGADYAGRELTEDSLTLRAVASAERMAGHSWKTLSPYESAGDCHAIIVAWLIEDEGHPPVEAGDIARAVTLGAIPDMLDTYEVVHGPKEDGTASGPTSG